jgi:hypothetical protein
MFAIKRCGRNLEVPGDGGSAEAPSPERSEAGAELVFESVDLQIERLVRHDVAPATGRPVRAQLVR